MLQCAYDQRTPLQSQFSFQHVDPGIELKSELEASALAIEHLPGPRGSLIFQEDMGQSLIHNSEPTRLRRSSEAVIAMK